MSLLPNDTFIGKLEYYEIYDDFDGPKCFSVKNDMGQIFFAYWNGDYKESNLSTWLLAPVSHKRLDALRRKEFSIRHVFHNPEQGFYYLSFDYASGKSKLEFVGKDSKLKINYPPESFFLDPASIEACDPEADWHFELRIAKRGKGHASPDTGMVTKIIDALSAIVSSLMCDESRKIPKIYPLSAKYGSFEVKLGSSDSERTYVAIEQLYAVLSNLDDLDNKLNDIGLDPYRLKDLLDITNQYHLKLELKPKTNEILKDRLLIGDTDLDGVIKQLEDSTATFIDSGKVPQANDIDRLIEIVALRAAGEKLNHENIDGLTSDRQVKYYTDAAYCLGLLNKNKSITSAGRFLCSKVSQDAKYRYLAERFESSDFGWAWMKWAGVSRMNELDESSAVDFIYKCVKGLNKATAKRRSSTLATWLSKLKAYCREYESETGGC
ncbi:hypothetical protein D3C78_588890 [compost metagenome]